MVSQNWDEIRRLMWNYVGIVRTGKRLARARRRLDMLREEIRQYYWDYQVTRDVIELRNIADVAHLIVDCATRRKESRGLHYTLDYLATDDTNWLKDTVIQREACEVGISRVAVYCGSKSGDSPLFLESARAFGTALAANGLDLVYGGAAHGMMGALASAVLEGGRHVIGVVPRGLARQEFAHPELSEHHLVDDMNARKALMADKADAFIALPGGFGTLDELFDMLTAAQLGLHHKPIGLLDVDGYLRAAAGVDQPGASTRLHSPAG